MKALYKLISILGILLGYTTDIMAQYGVFSTYQYQAKVISKDCNQNAGVVNIEFFIKKEDGSEYIIESIKTNKEGEFTYISRYIRNNSDIFIRLKPKSNTLFKDTSFQFIPKDVYELPYKGVPPCTELPTTEPDTSHQSQPDTNLALQPDVIPTILMDSLSIQNEDSVKMFYPELSGGDDKMNLYPNPNHGIFAIEFSATLEKIYLIEIYDMTGKQVFTKRIKSQVGKNTVKLNSMFLNPATYTLILRSDNKIAYKRYVQQ